MTFTNGLRAFGLGLGLIVLPRLAQADHAIYTDALQNGWDNWSWGSTLSFTNAAPVHAGIKSIAVTMTAGWAGFSLHRADLDTSPYESLSFWVHGGTSGGQKLKVNAELDSGGVTNILLSPLIANTWQQITLSLAELGVAGRPNFSRFSIASDVGSAQPVFYLDDLALVASATPPPAVALTSPASGASFLAPATIAFAATVTTNGHAINKVQFLNGAALLAEDATALFSFSWANVPAGTYSLSARLFFDATNTLDSAAASVTVVSNAPVTITVDALANRHPISPLIYGTAFATSNELAELNSPLNRSGGNAETRYNWQLNAHNHAADWYFQSIGDSPATPGAATDAHIAHSKNGGAQAMVTVPMIGWMPKLGGSRGKLASYSTNKYGPQTDTDWQWFPSAGNGVSVTNSTPIIWNDPNDANFLTNSSFQRAWVRSLTNRWGLATNGGVRYYLMDNEHTLWHSTHRDVHPVGTTMQEIRDKFFDYAGMVKAVDPDALVAAPEEWGWPGYLYSGYDQQWSGAHNDWNPAHYPDRGTNGGWDYLPWFLDQARQRATSTGQRLLDVFTVHMYPQGANESGGDVATATQLARNRSTRAFWDTNYVDQSWINSIIKLIPRLKGWVASYYPGTPIGITEYNWGAEGHINGATAQADILGICGREGLDLATRWTTPDPTTPTFKAMKLYRNYDGNRSTFGDTSVGVAGPNPDNVAAFAAVRTNDGALTVMVINKQLVGGQPVTLNLSNFFAGSAAQAWQLTSANTITRLTDVPLSNRSLSNTVPAQSLTLFIVPAGTPARLSAGTLSAGDLFNLWLLGQPGQRWALQASSDLKTWLPVQTNTLTASPLPLSLPTGGAKQRFYRAVWAP